MNDSKFTDEILHEIWNYPQDLESLKYIVDILCSFAYHEEPWNSKDTQNICCLHGIVSARINTLIKK